MEIDSGRQPPAAKKVIPNTASGMLNIFPKKYIILVLVKCYTMHKTIMLLQNCPGGVTHRHISFSHCLINTTSKTKVKARYILVYF